MPHASYGFYTVWDCGAVPAVPFGLFGGFATIEQLHDLDDERAVAAHIDATFRKLAVFYGHLLGIRPIRLLFDPAQVDHYRAETAALNARIARVAEATGLPLRHDVECLFLQARIERRALRVDLAESRKLNDAQSWADFATRSVCHSNHLTTAFHVPLEAAHATLGGRSADEGGLVRLAERVFSWSDKGACFRALATAPSDERLPFAPTAVRTIGGRVHHQDLRALLGPEAGARGRIFLKPVWGGGGIDAILVGPRESVAIGAPREYLVQAEVDSGTADEREGLPGRIGINLFLAPDGMPEIRAVTQQLYRDGACLSHLGAILEGEVSRRLLERIGERRILAHARLIQARGGISGPIGIDLVFDRHRRLYVDIVDANIRLTASAPTGFLGQLISEAGHRVSSIAVIGNDGLLDLGLGGGGLDRLRGAGFLYERSGGAGIVPIPSYRSSARYDAAFVNLGLDGVQAALDALAERRQPALAEIFSGPSGEASCPSAS